MISQKKKHNLFMIGYVMLLLFISIMAFNCSQASERKIVKQENLVPVLPEAVYTMSPDTFPFRFAVSEQAKFSARENKSGEYFCDVIYPELKAQIYCTWHRITPERFELMSEESRAMVYSHVHVATGIDERFYSNDSTHVYGLLYDLKGPVATPLQVALTDSANYFFNASLYFDVTPNPDSIAPYVKYIRKDIIRMMETFESVTP